MKRKPAQSGGGRRRGRGGSGGGGRRRTSAEPATPLHPTANPPDIRSFREWDLDPQIQEEIANMGIEVPTPIQRLAIQPVLDGCDVIGKAETGTGKTLAFVAPMMTRIEAARSTVLGLILCPTRELAQQVASVCETLGRSRGLSVALIVGGEPMYAQIDALKAGASIVVGTPGRVLDLYGQGFLSFPWTEFVVLDEADEMFEIGFIDDVRKILSYTPEERQTLLFSATFPNEVLRLARESTRDPVEVATASGVSTVDSIKQCFVHIDTDDRSHLLKRIIDRSAEDDVFLIFCDRRTEVDLLMRRLQYLRYPIKALHGGYDQASRFRVMSAFRAREVKALVATDVASRGLDVLHVTHVINFSVPQDVSGYTHRIGRTGRAGREGRAITMVSGQGQARWRDIVRNANWEIEEVEPVDLVGGGSRRGGESNQRRSESGSDGRSRRSERGGRSEGRSRPERTDGRDRNRPERTDGRDRNRGTRESERRPERSRGDARDDARPDERGQERTESTGRRSGEEERSRRRGGGADRGRNRSESNGARGGSTRPRGRDKEGESGRESSPQRPIRERREEGPPDRRPGGTRKSTSRAPADSSPASDFGAGL